MDNPANRIEEDSNDNDQLPLYSFFILLKQNGFSVTPKQITDSNKIISQYAGTVKNETELCDYISPLFAQNEDEQKQFRELFDLHFGEEQTVIAEEGNWKKAGRHLKKHWWKYFTGAAIVLTTVFIIWSIRKPGLKIIPPGILLVSEKTEEDFSGAFKLKTNEILELHTQTNNKLPDDETGIKLQTSYDWGDHSVIDTLSYHIYKKEGNYTITAYADVIFGKNKYKDTVSASVKVCSVNNDISIKQSPEGNPFGVIGQEVRLSADIRGKRPDRIIWTKDGIEQNENGNVFITSFDTDADHTVNCTAVYDSLNSPCTIQKSIDLAVTDPNKPVITASINKSPGESVPLSPQHRIRSFWFYLAGGLLILSLLLYSLLTGSYNKAKEKSVLSGNSLQEKYQDLLTSFAGNKPPFELPFHNKNYLPIPQPGLNELARQMRKRINDETTYLDLPKTIEKSINSGGLFQPVNIPRTQQSEYLLLIDETQRNNQQVKLFEYLAEVLNRQNVQVEKYYYRNDLELCYNVSEPNGISFEKLSAKYAKHVLLVCGNAYELLFPFYPVFNYDHLQLLNRWQYKSVLTPVSFADWSSKEFKGLSPVIPVFPVDNEGLLLFIQTIFSEEQSIIADLYQQQRSFYDVEKTDFENVDELEAYCDKAGWAIIYVNGAKTNILFQWIAALAVYPKIRWEITLAIGKSVLDKYGKTEELNYSNLLRIVRIKWMKEGRFPDYTRLELLKKLSKENEIIARETILSLLKEIPGTEVNPGHFAYEEMEIQRIINEFNLYAYDPVKYSLYGESKKLFEQLWKEKKIQDSPAKVYFKKGGDDWNTLFNKTSPGGEKINVGIDEYLEPGKPIADPGRNFFQRAITVCSIVFLVSLLGFLILTYLNFFSNAGLPGLTYKAAVLRDIKFTYINNTKDTSFNSGLLIVDNNMNETLENNKQKIVRLITDDSARQVSFNTGGADIFDTLMVIDQDAYTISLKGDDDITAPSSGELIVNFRLADKCGSSMNEFERIVKNTRSDLIVTYSIITENSSVNNDCINRIAFGKGVTAELSDSLIVNFKAKGYTLQKSIQSADASFDNKIDIYSEASSPVTPKPVIYIQYNNKQSLKQVQQLQACLNKGIFNVPGIEYQPQANYSRSEIRYFEYGMKDSIALLQACLRSVYPGKTFYPVKIPIKHSNARAEVWVYDSLNENKPNVSISVFDKSLLNDKSLLAQVNAFGRELATKGYRVDSAIAIYPLIEKSSVISYSYDVKAKDVQEIKYLYDIFFPDMPVITTSRLRPAFLSDVRVIIISNTPDTTTSFSETIVSVASKEVGYSENPPESNKTKYGKWYGADSTYWSAIFISWVYAQAGKPLPAIDGKKGFVSYTTGLNYFRKNNLIVNKPTPGDIVIFELDGKADQVSTRHQGGIFVKWENEKSGSYELIEGNSSAARDAGTIGVIRRIMNINSNKTFFIHIK